MSKLNQKRLKGRHALITGASKGLGAAVAERFAQEGAHLILVARSLIDLEKLDDRLQKYDIQTTLVPMDLQEHSKIEEMAAAIYQRFQRLDILVGNAATLGTLAPLPHISPFVWHEVMALNLTTNWHLLRAFDLLLRQAPHGRAIFVTCENALIPHPYWAAYATSKRALEYMVQTYAQEIINTTPKLKVNLICPPPLKTALRAQAFPGEDQANLTRPEEITEIFVLAAASDTPHHGSILK